MATKRRSRRRHPARLARLVAGTASAGLAVGLVSPMARATDEAFDERADAATTSQAKWAVATASQRAAATASTIIDQPATPTSTSTSASASAPAPAPAPAVEVTAGSTTPPTVAEDAIAGTDLTTSVPDSLSTTIASVVAPPRSATAPRRETTTTATETTTTATEALATTAEAPATTAQMVTSPPATGSPAATASPPATAAAPTPSWSAPPPPPTTISSGS